MAKSKQMRHWNIASSMMALAAEINRDRRRRLRLFRPEPILWGVLLATLKVRPQWLISAQHGTKRHGNFFFSLK
jgi:hypothetical protein